MLINLNEKMYDGFIQEYLENIASEVERNYENCYKKNKENYFFKHVKKEDIKEILVGNISNNANLSFINDYRNAIIFSEIPTQKGIFQKIKNSELSSWKYTELRLKIIEIYDNDLVSNCNLIGSKYYSKSMDKFKELQNAVKVKINEINTVVSEIFSYETLTNKKELRAKIMNFSKIEICPYCNRNFISRFLDKDNKEKSAAQLDHFFPKTKFPLFSLSIKNFIPTCATCNGVLKGAKIFSVKYPLNSNGNSDIFFSIKYNSIGELQGTLPPKYIGIKKEFSTLDETADVETLWEKLLIDEIYEELRIESIYQNHLNFVKDLNWKQNIYNNSYIDFTNRLLNTNMTKEDIYLLEFGYRLTEEELLQKPLSKLAQDVLLPLKYVELNE